MFDSVRAARGVIRSLRSITATGSGATRIDRHYARFVAKGYLVFDIGSHVADRVCGIPAAVGRR